MVAILAILDFITVDWLISDFLENTFNSFARVYGPEDFPTEVSSVWKVNRNHRFELCEDFKVVEVKDTENIFIE